MLRTVARTVFIRLVHQLIAAPALVCHHYTRGIQTLAFEEIKASPEKPHQYGALILQVLLGFGRNWRSFSRSLAASLAPAQWRMMLVDLRNHGKSAELDGFLPPCNLENAAKDLANLVRSQGWDWPDVVVGHSTGGKVALQFAQSCANGDYRDIDGLPKQNSCGY